MAAHTFEKGNQLWKLREFSGRMPKYKKSEEIWDKACAYFQYTDDNPIVSFKAVLGKDGPEQLEQLHTKPYTLDGLQIYMGICDETWRAYTKKTDFIGVCSAIEKIVRDNKFSGATVGIFNHQIIARDLGLKEASSVDLKTPEGITFHNNYGGKDD